MLREKTKFSSFHSFSDTVVPRESTFELLFTPSLWRPLCNLCRRATPRQSHLITGGGRWENVRWLLSTPVPACFIPAVSNQPADL